jgi:hypothetical protein
VAAAGRRAEEHVVSDIGDNVGAGVAVIVSFIVTENLYEYLPPLPGRGDASDAAQGLGGELQSSIGEALDLAMATGPRPLGAPLDIGARKRFKGGALGARGRTALTPKVIVEDIAALSDIVPLAAKRGGCLGQSLR